MRSDAGKLAAMLTEKAKEIDGSSRSVSNQLRPGFGEIGFAGLGSQAVLIDSHFYFVD
jgi:hypothetical protein